MSSSKRRAAARSCSSSRRAPGKAQPISPAPRGSTIYRRGERRERVVDPRARAKYHDLAKEEMMKTHRAGPLRSGVKFALVAIVFASQAFAQEGSQPVAQLRDVTGNTLVSRESGLAAGTEGLRLVPGTRVITTNKSGVIVVFDDGCQVRLKENERFEVV